MTSQKAKGPVRGVRKGARNTGGRVDQDIIVGDKHGGKGVGLRAVGKRTRGEG